MSWTLSNCHFSQRSSSTWIFVWWVTKVIIKIVIMVILATTRCASWSLTSRVSTRLFWSRPTSAELRSLSAPLSRWFYQDFSNLSLYLSDLSLYLSNLSLYLSNLSLYFPNWSLYCSNLSLYLSSSRQCCPTRTCLMWTPAPSSSPTLSTTTPIGDSHYVGWWTLWNYFCRAFKGSLNSPSRVLQEQIGNSFEMSILLVSLLRSP